MNQNGDILYLLNTILLGLHREPSMRRLAELVPTYFMSVNRCTVFKIFIKGGKLFCRIVAGEDHDKDHKEYHLGEHPDIQWVWVDGCQSMLISDPLNDRRTKYFKKLIEAKNIKEIFYIPVIMGKHILYGNTGYVIVLDGMFTENFQEYQALTRLAGCVENIMQLARSIVLNERIKQLIGYSLNGIK